MIFLRLAVYEWGISEEFDCVTGSWTFSGVVFEMRREWVGATRLVAVCSLLITAS